MKKFFIFLFLMILTSLSFVSALSISPAEIDFDLVKGEQECKMITIRNDESINVQATDKWTDDVEDKGYLSKYTGVSSEFNIGISYEEFIENLEDEEVEVCLTGNEVGEYFGALVYQVESSGGVSAGVGTWLMVNVQEETEETTQPSNSGSSSSGSTGGSSNNGVEVGVENEEVESKYVQGRIVDTESGDVVDEEDGEYESVVTGATVGSTGKSLRIVMWVVAALIIIGGVVYFRRKK